MKAVSGRKKAHLCPAWVQICATYGGHSRGMPVSVATIAVLHGTGLAPFLIPRLGAVNSGIIHH